MDRFSVGEIIEQVEKLRPNAVSRDLKVQWLSEAEGETAELLNLYAIDWYKSTEETEESATSGEDPLELGEPLLTRKEKIEAPIYSEAEHNAKTLLPKRFAGIYTAYITAKIDFIEDESENYQNDSLLYEAERKALVGYLMRNYPRREARVRGI